MSRHSSLAIPVALLVTLGACSQFMGGSRPQGPEGTRVLVHVATHDAKLIADEVGGARVTVRDAASGRVLVEGETRGTTGDTQRIMVEPRRRGTAVYRGGDGSSVELRVPITRPTQVEITAEGPLNYPDQMASTTKRMTLLPGAHVTSGDGIVLEMHGFIIDILAPDTTSTLPANATVPVRARVRLLCSCPTQPDGMWRTDEVLARLTRDGEIVREATLRYAGEQSTYVGDLRTPDAGRYVLELVSSRAERATFGVVRREVRVEGSGS
jgi:hypothetical protein